MCKKTKFKRKSIIKKEMLVNFKYIILSITFLFCYNLVSSQNRDIKDVWSGKYDIKPYVENGEDFNLKFCVIEKTTDAKAENLTSKYETDLLRWNMITQNGSEKDSVLLRRFLINNEYNEYEEFGWTELYKSGKMKCVDGGHFFICQTTAGSKVKIGEEEFISKTGIFGIALHKGLFEFSKWNENDTQKNINENRLNDTLIVSLTKKNESSLVNFELHRNTDKLIVTDTVINPSFSAINYKKITNNIGVVTYTYGIGNTIEKYKYKINLNDAVFYELLVFSTDSNTCSISNEKINIKFDEFSSEKIYELSTASNKSVHFSLPLNMNIENGTADIKPYENLVVKLYQEKRIDELKLACNQDVYNIINQYFKFNDLKYLNSFNNIAYYLVQSKLYPEAIYLLKKIIKNFPKRTVAYINIGDAYWNSQHKEKAKDAYKIYREQMKEKGNEEKIPKRVFDRIK